MRITPFLSWDLLHVGAVAWTDRREPIRCDVPEGVALQVEPARRTAPLFEKDRPWEQGAFGWAQVLKEGDRYRMWYSVRIDAPAQRELLCTAESRDGVTWEKPELGLVEVDGSRANNVVFSAVGMSHACVLIGPPEPAETRFRCLYFKAWWEGAPGELLTDEEGHRRLDLKNAAGPEDQPLPVRLLGKMMGMTSPDGKRWTPLAEPVLDEWHDTHNIAVYDSQAGLYRAYLRGFYGGRRAISYAETRDFAHWLPSRVIHHSLPTDAPDESLYSNGYSRYPGCSELHLMFPAIYRQSEDITYGQLAVSQDGVNWARLTGQALIPQGPPGAPDGGMVYPEPELLRCPERGVMRLLCHCGPRYHNEWYNERLRTGETSYYCWAEWPEDRLAGVVAEATGSFTLPPQPCGDRLLANYRCQPGGWVKFELVDRLVWPPQPWPGIPGFRFEESIPLEGDATHAPVRWVTRDTTAEWKGRPVAIRVRLHRAKLFSVTTYGADEPWVREDPRYPV